MSTTSTPAQPRDPRAPASFGCLSPGCPVECPSYELIDWHMFEAHDMPRDYRFADAGAPTVTR